MANEGRATLSYTIRKGNVNENRSMTALFDVTSGKGPSPGAITVPTTGVNVSFDNLSDPNLLVIINLDETNYVTWGVYDGVTYTAVGRIDPGDWAKINLADNIDAGTGTSGSNLRLVANTASCVVQVLGHDR